MSETTTQELKNLKSDAADAEYWMVQLGAPQLNITVTEDTDGTFRISIKRLVGIKKYNVDEISSLTYERATGLLMGINLGWRATYKHDSVYKAGER